MLQQNNNKLPTPRQIPLEASKADAVGVASRAESNGSIPASHRIDRKYQPHDGGPFSLMFPEEQHELDTSVQWVIEGLIRKGALISINGLPAARKSWLALDAALCIGNGLDDFLGFEVQHPGPALVVCADDGAKTAVRRLRMISRFRLGHESYGGVVLVDRGQLNLQARDAGLRLDNTLKMIHDRFDAPPALVVVDTSSMAGAPTSDFGHSYPEKLRWLKMVTATHDCCVALVDHMSKPKEDAVQLDVRISGWGGVLKAGMSEGAWSLERQDSLVRFRASDKEATEAVDCWLSFSQAPNEYSVEVADFDIGDRDDIKRYAQEHGDFEIKDVLGALKLSDATARRRIRQLVKEGYLIQKQRAGGTRAAVYGLRFEVIEEVVVEETA